ncbi:MAG: GtrA family protein [Bosea sp. (in: a-proteobacteria)]
MLNRLLAIVPLAQRQLVAFAFVGVAAAVVHFGLLVGLVELFSVNPVRATLAGYVAGGVVSYALNRWLTFEATRSHSQAGWRFGVIAFGGFLLTGVLMSLFVNRLGLPYLPMQVVTTLIVMAFSFLGHKYWSFAEGR